MKNIIEKEKLDGRRKYTLDLTNIMNDSHEKYYWLGFIAGDGNIASSEARLRIELKEEDEQLLIYFNEFMQSNTPLVKRVNNKGTHCCCLSINSAKLKRYLANYNIVPNKSKIFEIPMDKISDEYKLDFVRGLLDADGYIGIRKDRNENCLNFISANKKCVEQVEFILGINNTISTNNGAYCFNKSGKEIKNILDKVYENSTEKSRLERKYNIYRSMIG